MTSMLAAGGTSASFAAEPTDTLEEVVVTAERHETALQTTPVAITALGAADLERLQINGAKDLGAIAPSLNVMPNIASTSAITTSMRGNQEQNGAVLYSEGGVGWYVDGVYRRLTSAGLDLLDVERVEVLRGPQGTLFGRNTLAGAINIVTSKPGPQTKANAELSYGAYQTIRARGSISGELSEGLYGGIAVVYRDRGDGWMHEQFSKRDVGTGTYKGAEAQLRYVSGNFEGDLRAFLSRSNTDGAYASPVSVATLRPVYSSQVDVASVSPTFNGSVLQPLTSNHQQNVDLTLQWKFDGVTLKSISSYLDMPRDDWAVDLTAAQAAGPAAGVSGFFRYSVGDQKQFSEDLQLTGATDKIDWTGGLYYYTEKTNQLFRDWFFGFPSTPADHHLKATSVAAYAQMRYAFNDAFAGVIGGRYTHDNKKFSGIEGNAAGVPTAFGSEKSFNKFTGKLGLEYKISPELFSYATFSQGFKSGTYDYYASAEFIATPLEPELVDSIELGLKSELLGRTLRLNLAVFDTKYKNLAVGAIVPGVGLTTRNAGTERVTGLEGELTWKANSFLTLYTTLSVMDPRWTQLSAQALATGVKLSDRPPLAYKSQGSAGITITAPLSWSELAFNANVNYVGDQYQQVVHLYSETVHIPSRTTADASLSFSNGPHTVTAAVKNLTNNTDRVVASDFSTFLFNNTTAFTPAEARTWELKYRYALK